MWLRTNAASAAGAVASMRCAAAGLLVLTAYSCASPPDERCDYVEEASFEPQPLGAVPEWYGSGYESRPIGGGFYVRSLLPWTYGRESVYSVQRGDPARVRLSFAAGTEDVTTAVTLFVLVEGRAIEVLADGLLGRRVEVGFEGGLGAVEIEIPPGALAPGLNQVDLLYFGHRRGNWRLFVGTPFTVANGSIEPQTYEDTPDLAAGTYVPNQPTSAFRNVPLAPAAEEAPFGSWTPAVGSLADPTPVILRIQASSLWATCPRSEDEEPRLDRVMVVGFRDLEPEPLGGLDRLVATLPVGEQRVYRYDMALFPAGEQHNYTAVVLSGFGRPARMNDGIEAPWVWSRPLIQVWWGWSP